MRETDGAKQEETLKLERPIGQLLNFHSPQKQDGPN